jgi:hypothetical protein
MSRRTRRAVAARDGWLGVVAFVVTALLLAGGDVATLAPLLAAR